MSKSLDISFVHRYLWYSKDTQQAKKPYTYVSLKDRCSGALYPVWALIDTGADRTLLDSRIGSAAGYDVNDPQSLVHIKVASGVRAPFYRVKHVELEIEGRPVRQDVLFSKGGVNLIGRSTIFAAIDFGMDDEGWLFKYI